MVLSVDSSGAFLVAGRAVSSEEEKMKELQMKKVRVLRAFYDHNRKPTKTGDIVEIPKWLAVEVRAANKAEYIEEQTAPPAANEKAKTVSPADKKEANHAR